AFVPLIPGLAEAGYLTNETAFSQRDLPARLAVIGRGPVGCELGQAFARLGSQVTIVQRAERLLPRDEPEASAVLHMRLVAKGILVVTRARVIQVSRREEGKVAPPTRRMVRVRSSSTRSSWQRGARRTWTGSRSKRPASAMTRGG